MNAPIMLAILGLFGFGFGSFLWKVAGANQVYGPSWMIVEGLTFAIVGVVIHLLQRHSFDLSTRMTGLAALGGILAAIAVFSDASADSSAFWLGPFIKTHTDT